MPAMPEPNTPERGTTELGTAARGTATVPVATADTVLDSLLQRTLSARSPLHGVSIGRILMVEAEGPLVHLDVLGNAPVRARTACPLPPDCTGRECAVLFVDGDPATPLIMGLLLTSGGTAPAADDSRELRVDGTRVIIEADQELELRCGESVILLQRDGRIEIRGNYVTSQATATQRIRGGSVHVN